MKNILVPIDFSDGTAAVIKASRILAREHCARIVLLSVAAPPVLADAPAPGNGDFPLRDDSKVGAQLAHYGDTLNAEGVETEPYERFGPPVECILDEARRISADYIVMGSHGHTALYEAFVGSTTGRVLKDAPCPVVVVSTICRERSA
jgi:nucleotide-binding universal stress UspA family protein